MTKVQDLTKRRAHAALTTPELEGLLDFYVTLTPNILRSLPDPDAAYSALIKIAIAIDDACTEADADGETFIFASISTT